MTAPRRRFHPGILGVVLVVVLAAAVGFWVQSRPVAPEGPPPEVVPEGKEVCEQFMALKNAGDPAADELLGRVPVVPDGALSQAEADSLQTDFFLRQDLRVVRVEVEGMQAGHRRTAMTGRLVLNTRGNASAPTLLLRTPQGVERSQRTVSNPDLVVEARDGKIYGVRAELYTGP